jgi:hypothetical protein
MILLVFRKTIDDTDNINDKIFGKCVEQPEADINCGVLYTCIPLHESSTELQNELFRYCLDDKHVLLFGDYSSRCSKRDDFVKVDNFCLIYTNLTS